MSRGKVRTGVPSKSKNEKTNLVSERTQRTGTFLFLRHSVYSRLKSVPLHKVNGWHSPCSARVGTAGGRCEWGAARWAALGTRGEGRGRMLLRKERFDKVEDHRYNFRALCTKIVSDNFQLFRRRDLLDSGRRHLG